MKNLKTLVEALLFISNKPLAVKKMAELCASGKVEVETVLKTLAEEYNQAPERGVRLILNGDTAQLATASAASEVVEKFVKEELTGEMTRPQLEALTIIVYRGPITKMELEQIRGVNCSLILRNLMIRGLVESELDKKMKIEVYRVTNDFLRFLGVTSAKELPDYEKLSKSEVIQNILERNLGMPKQLDGQNPVE